MKLIFLTPSYVLCLFVGNVRGADCLSFLLTSPNKLYALIHAVNKYFLILMCRHTVKMTLFTLEMAYTSVGMQRSMAVY